MAPIQVTFRIPWIYKVQLDKVAFDQGVSVPNLVVEALEDQRSRRLRCQPMPKVEAAAS